MAKTFYVLNTAAASPGYFGQLQDGGTAPTAANATFGYAPGKLAVSNYCQSRLGASSTSATTASTSYVSTKTGPTAGTGATNTTSGDSFITPTPYNGSFVSGNWTFTFNMIATTAGLTGRLGIRVWASTSNTGASARELTSGEIFAPSATTGTAIATSATALTATWAAPAITLTNEYVFFQLEYQEGSGTAGSSNSDNALFRVGSTIATTNWTDTSATAALPSASNLTVPGYLLMWLRAPQAGTYPGLLMHLDTDFSDSSGRHSPVVENISTSTTQPKFGAGSAYFPPNPAVNTDVYINDNLSDLTCAGDFTIDMWFYPTAYSWGTCLFNGFDGAIILYGAAGASTLNVYAGGAAITGTTSLSLNTWYHVALVRSGSSVKMYINGVQDGSTWTTSATFTTASIFRFGVNPGGQSTGGYIDEIRVVNGLAAWTANFTPPTSAYTSLPTLGTVGGDIPAFAAGSGLAAIATPPLVPFMYSKPRRVITATVR